MGWVGAWLRQLRTSRAGPLGLALLVLLTAFVAALVPRLAGRAADAALREVVTAASEPDRNVELIEERRLPSPARSALAAADRTGRQREAQMPAGVRELIADRRFLVDTPRWSIATRTPSPSTLRLRVQPGARERLRLVEGRWPTGATRREPPDRLPGAQATDDVLVVEAALSHAALASIGARAGDVVVLEVDETERLSYRTDQAPLGVAVVGVIEPVDRDDPFWSEETLLWEPFIRVISGDVQFVDVHALLDGEGYQALLEATAVESWAVRHTWRYVVDPARLDAARLEATVADLRRLEGTFPRQTTVVGPISGTVVGSALLRILEGHRTRSAAGEVVLTVAGTGPVVVAGIALGLVAVLVVAGRRRAFEIALSRGASPWQVGAAALVDAALFVALPAVLGAAAAGAVVPETPAAPSLGAAGLVAAIALALWLAAAAWAATRPPPERRTGRRISRPSSRRLAIEGLVAALAVIGVVLLRDRGLAGTSSAGRLESADPLVAAVPALAGLAAGLVAVRLVPVPIGLLARLAAGRRDLVPVLGLRRSTRDRDAAPILVVLLVATTVGTFTLASLAQLEHAAEAVAWHDVGAPYRLTRPASTLPSDLSAAASVPGLDAAAGASEAQGSTGGGTLRFTVLALDAAQYEAVVAGTAGEVTLPPSLLAASAPGEPLPAIVSSALAGVDGGPRPGGTFEMSVGAVSGSFRAVDVRDAFPTMPVDGRFAVVSREHLRALGPTRLATTALFVRADGAAPDQVRAALARLAPGGLVEERAERAARLRSGPIVATVVGGIALAAGLAALYAAVGLAVALAIATAGRMAETGQLRALGLSARQAVVLVLVEHGPTMVLALVAGTALGLALFTLLGTAIGLGTVVGSRLAVPLAFGPLHALVLAVAVLAVASIGLALAAALERRTGPGPSRGGLA